MRLILLTQSVGFGGLSQITHPGVSRRAQMRESGAAFCRRPSPGEPGVISNFCLNPPLGALGLFHHCQWVKPKFFNPVQARSFSPVFIRYTQQTRHKLEVTQLVTASARTYVKTTKPPKEPKAEAES